MTRDYSNDPELEARIVAFVAETSDDPPDLLRRRVLDQRGEEFLLLDSEYHTMLARIHGLGEAWERSAEYAEIQEASRAGGWCGRYWAPGKRLLDRFDLECRWDLLLVPRALTASSFCEGLRYQLESVFNTHDPQPWMDDQLKSLLEGRLKFWIREARKLTRTLGLASTQPNPTVPQTGLTAESSGAERRAAVEAFLLRCNDMPGLGVKIIRKHIWLAVGHKKETRGRQFQYWQAGSGNATSEDDKNFGRILALDPAKLVAIIRNKKLI